MMIPKLIHHIWLQGQSSVPENLRALQKECIAINHNAQFVLWDAPTIEELIMATFPDLLPLFRKPRPHAQQSDIGRYVILYVFGGVYLDMDYQCYKSIGLLLDNPGVDLFYVPFTDPGGTRIMNAIIGCKQGHPLLRLVIEEMIYRLSKKPGKSVTYTTGTRLLMDMVIKYHNLYPMDDRYLIISHTQLFPCNVWDDDKVCNTKHKNISFMSHKNEGSWNKGLFAVIKWLATYKLYVAITLILVIAYIAYTAYAKKRCRP